MDTSQTTSLNGCETTVPTVACLCLASMRRGPPLDVSCWDDYVASLFLEPLGDSHMIGGLFCGEAEKDIRKRPADDDAFAMNADDASTAVLGETKHGNEKYGTGTRIDVLLTVAHKRRKIARASSLLLECRPEVLRYVRSFLTLQDALILRSTCRKLYNDGYDAYRYSRLLTCKALAKDGFSGRTCSWNFMQNQDHVLMRNQNDDKLRAILLNEFIPSYHLRRLIWTLIKTTKTDNASAVSLLIQDGRCDVDPFMLDQALRRNYTSIAAVLQQDDRIKAAIQMCATCHVNIGCYECFRDLDCARLPEPAHGRIWCSWDDLPPAFRRPHKYCRACVMADNNFCRICKEYLCRDCIACQNHGSCEACHSILCLDDFLSKQPVVICDECPRMKCRSCLGPEEKWLEVIESGFPITLCPDCKGSFVPSSRAE